MGVKIEDINIPYGVMVRLQEETRDLRYEVLRRATQICQQDDREALSAFDVGQAVKEYHAEQAQGESGEC